MTLRTENLTVSYGTDKVLNDVSLSLPTGKITALIGPNGCGKIDAVKLFFAAFNAAVWHRISRR